MAEAMFSAYLDRTVYLMHNCDISGQMEALLQRLEQFDGDYDKMADETAVAVLEILQKLHNQGSSHTRTLPEQIKEWIDLHVEENVKLEQLCESLHYSRNHLINQFQTAIRSRRISICESRKLKRQSAICSIPVCRFRKSQSGCPIRMKIIFTAALKRRPD